jgi:hypothetical protein
MKYLQITDGVVRHAFAGPQVAKDWPGLIQVEDDDSRYVSFVAPMTPDKAAIAYSMRDSLLAVAALRIAPLQDAVDLGNATEETRTSLGKWKQYRIDLSGIGRQSGFPADIQWPLSPDDVSTDTQAE